MLLRIICTLLITVSAAQLNQAQVTIHIDDAYTADERVLYINRVLDSMIAGAFPGKGGIICVNEQNISIDTITLNKVKRVKADSVVVGKFLKKNQKKISSGEFWGLTSASGETSRFYLDKMYLIWESPSPYIYKINDVTKTEYYYSETLSSPIYDLTKDNVSVDALSPAAKEILNKFIEETAREELTRKHQVREEIAAASLDILTILFQVLLIADNHSTFHSKGSHQNYQKRETGRRK